MGGRVPVLNGWSSANPQRRIVTTSAFTSGSTARWCTLHRAMHDADICADKTDDYRDIANAASLLSRLELKGIAVGDP